MLRVLVFAGILAIGHGCHHSQGVAGRHKRALSPPGPAMRIADTITLRDFFTNCMQRRAGSIFPSFQTILDYVVLDTNWYKNSDNITCSLTSDSDTAACWIARLGSLIIPQSPLYTASRACISDFVTFTAEGGSGLGTGFAGEGSVGRFKRQAVLDPDVGDTDDYINCFENKLHLPDDRNPISVPILVRFIRNHTVCKLGANIEDCKLNQTTRALVPRNFAYRLEGLTRLDSPLRYPIIYCNNDIFPIVFDVPVRRTDACYSGMVVNGVSLFRTERCAPLETMCQTKIVANGPIKIVEKKCKHGQACLSNWSGNRQNCYGENALKNGVRVCHFCCAGDLCNESSEIPPN
ncbi:uncharacterized protein LOC100177026 [Ciona intestinalis]